MLKITLLLCILLITACKSTTQSDEYTLHINSKQSECYHPFQQLCFEIRTEDQEDFSIRGAPIVDFDYEFGHQYELKVYDETDLFGIGAPDGSAVKTHIVEIVAIREDPIGTPYTYTIHMSSSRVRAQDDGTYNVFGLTFLCGENIDCEPLLHEYDNKETISFNFIYEGNGIMKLSSWIEITED